MIDHNSANKGWLSQTDNASKKKWSSHNSDANAGWAGGTGSTSKPGWGNTQVTNDGWLGGSGNAASNGWLGQSDNDSSKRGDMYGNWNADSNDLGKVRSFFINNAISAHNTQCSPLSETPVANV